jgi:acetyl-CoA carboxylase carboxyltransferase component
MVLAYDYTVFAGTQGGMGHKKLDRMLAVAARSRLPIVLFAEGGGGGRTTPTCLGRRPRRRRASTPSPR